MTTQTLILSQTAQPVTMAKAGMMANMMAQQYAFTRYMNGKSENTLKRQATDLALFAQYLADAGIVMDCVEFQKMPACWAGITWGIVEGFVAWQLSKGYAVSSANVRLSTVKTYAKLAAKAGVIAPDDLAMIETVKGYSRKEGLRVDEKRETTRKGDKKATATKITAKQAKSLLEQPTTPQGRRDALMMALLLEHGLRAGEAVALTIDNFDVEAGELKFYRPKVNKDTTQKLTARTLRALLAYLPHAPKEGALLVASKRGGSLTDRPMTRVTLSRRVGTLGKGLGVDKLSAHDCRHYCATDMAKKGYGIKRLMEWFGWASPAMAMRYIADSDVLERDLG